MQITSRLTNFVLTLTTVVGLYSCGPKAEKSTVSGMTYGDKKMGGFSVAKPKDTKVAPGLVFVQGGTFTMGATEEDVLQEWNNIPRRVTVNSFFIDKTEVANVNYREYLYWLEHMFTDTPKYNALLNGARPDSLVWRKSLSYNEPYVEYYFRHPSYNYYPVVGVSWKQAYDFCQWRTDIVNEYELKKLNYIDNKQTGKSMFGQNDNHFVTKSYLMGEYQAKAGSLLKSSSNPLKDENGKGRNPRFEDGVMFADYRLPSEAEWEYAAYGYITENPQRKPSKTQRGEENIQNKQIYSWKDDGFSSLRSTKPGGYQGAMLANFKRGNGDYMGVAGGLNDNAAITAEVTSYMPNGYGLYNMSGNVSEWVADVYRPLTSIEADDFNPLRGNIFKKVDMSAGQGNLRDSLGRIKMVLESDSALKDRRNYRKAYAVDYMDGDSTSQVAYGYGVTTLVSDKSRVIKGGSWNDGPYWLAPGSRRYMEEDQSSSTVGFRCAMTHYGASEDLKATTKTGNIFPQRKQRR